MLRVKRASKKKKIWGPKIFLFGLNPVPDPYQLWVWIWQGAKNGGLALASTKHLHRFCPKNITNQKIYVKKKLKQAIKNDFKKWRPLVTTISKSCT